jgi:tetratricopeptide (TPR) repeat protein
VAQRKISRSKRNSGKPENGRKRGLLWGAIALVALLVGAALLDFTCRVPRFAWFDFAHDEPQTAQYVGSKACVSCHEKETSEWQKSQHHDAMAEASAQSMLGDFNDARFAYAGVTSRFFKRDGKFFVNTDGPDGKLADFEIKYTFGVTPLQQYLIQFPGGRLQALGIAWDARPKEQGGQRWFHLYPKERVTHKDLLHWTAIDQNWNYQCAECHSTNLQKRYDSEKSVYDTTWSEINVACEACHGPASAHVDWAKNSRGQKIAAGNHGLVVQFDERRGVTWNMDQASGIARRSVARATNTEIDGCARCHSRRGVLTEHYPHGRPLLDTHMPALLTEELYYSDGQIQGEVYEYGSFLQSRMYAEGVTCSDCHEPHSLKLRAEGSQVCAQCHAPAKFATSQHHHHNPGSQGADCLGCHMPQRNYMVVDPRRDHSFRVPRPDLSARNGAPNACSVCHKDKSVDWAAGAFGKWFKPEKSAQEIYAEALRGARAGEPDAANKLVTVAQQIGLPAIARATALAELRRYFDPKTIAVVQQGLKDREPLVRLGALRALEGVGSQSLQAETIALLQDPVRAVRATAASLLAGISLDALSAPQRAALDSAIEEYVADQRINADRPEAQLNLGSLYARRGEFDKAENHFRQALTLQPSFAPAYVNLADMYRARGRDPEGEKILRYAVQVVPDDAGAAHALGLLLVREKKFGEALSWLKRAAELAPANPRYAYVYGVALHSTGDTKGALNTLAAAHRRNPGDRELLYALATINRDAGSLPAARSYADKLAALAPDDPAIQTLQKQLAP